jgi:hypothetical protein
MQREKDTEKQINRETEKQRQKQRERERERERKRELEKDDGGVSTISRKGVSSIFFMLFAFSSSDEKKGF